MTAGSVPGTGAVIPPGHTRDPKTGRVFKLTPKKGHSVERQRLEGNLKEATKAFSVVLKDGGITISDAGVPTRETEADGDLRCRYTNSLTTVNSAKAELAAYKAAHREEFLPPASKKTPRKPQMEAREIKDFPSPKGESPPWEGSEDLGPQLPEGAIGISWDGVPVDTRGNPVKADTSASARK
jgi:hypothetical protein